MTQKNYLFQNYIENMDIIVKAPKLNSITPSGRFGVGNPIFLQFTNFHAECWSSAQIIESIMISTISFVYTKENTTREIISSSQEKYIYYELEQNHHQFDQLQ